MGKTIRKTEKTTLHFDLSHGHADTKYTLQACLKEYPLERHTPETLAESRKTNKAVAKMPDHRITHYVSELEHPSDMPLLFMVTSPPKHKGAKLETLEMMAIHLPCEARRKAINEMRQHNAHPSIGQAHPKLAMYGIEAKTEDDAPLIIDVHNVKTAMDAACTLVFHHVELMNLDKDTACKVMTHIEHSVGISELAKSIYDQAMAHKDDPDSENWITERSWLDPKDLSPMPGQSRYAWSDKTQEWIPGPMKSALKTTKNAPDLRSTTTTPGCWTVLPGQPSTGVTGDTNPPAMPEIEMTEFDTKTIPKGFTLSNLTAGHGLEVGKLSYSDVDKIFGVEFKNTFLRWLSVYVEFLDQEGQPIKPSTWNSINGKEWDTDTEKFVDRLSAVNTILAIPLPADFKNITFPWPDGASSARIKLGGLGKTNGINGVGCYETPVCTIGTIITCIFNLAIPSICILAGALITGAALNALAKLVFKELLIAVRLAFTESAAASQLKHGNKGMWETLGNSLVRAAITGVPGIAIFIGTKVGEGAVEKAIPILGGIATAINITVDLAMLGETIGEVVTSPATFVNKIDRKMDIQLTILPDPKDPGHWPEVATHYRVSAIYSPSDLKNGKTGKVFPVMYDDGSFKGTPDIPLLKTTQKGKINLTMKDVPWGGQVTFLVSFYSDSNWLAGYYKSPNPVAAQPTNKALPTPTMVVPEFHIKEKLVPLTADTYYIPKEELFYEGGKHKWLSRRFEIKENIDALINDLNTDQVTNALTQAFSSSGQITLHPEAVIKTTRQNQWLIIDKEMSFYVNKIQFGENIKGSTVWKTKIEVASGNTATRANLDGSNIGHNLWENVGITLSERNGMVGYTWQASGLDIPKDRGSQPDTGQMFAFQNISDGADPESALKFIQKGFSMKPYLVYDFYGSDSKEGNNFFIDPRDGGYHLRKVKLGDSGPFDLSEGQSWGRFNQQIDAASIHPNGYVVGISNKNCTVEVIPILKESVPDDQAPYADIYSGVGSRDGLIHNPVAVAVTPNGTVLVLETKSDKPPGDPQVQAMDYHANPVYCFKNKSAVMTFKKESQNVTYLDLAAESKGYIYILKYLGDGYNVEDYCLDIYSPDGAFLSQTVGVNAAKMTVSLWRNLFTLNYRILSGPNGRTEPSANEWIPSTPKGVESSS